MLATALVLLTALVQAGRTEDGDRWTREFFRPGGAWGDLQVRVDLIVEGLKPRNVAALLVLVSGAVSLRRRSWRPLVCTAAVGALGAALTLAVKVAVQRTDTHGEIGGIGGSYPSGHVVAVLVTAGCLALMLQRRPTWPTWVLVTLAGALMSWALLVQAAHWLTDVAGGFLLGGVVLLIATFLPFHPPGETVATARTGRSGPPGR